MRNYKISKATNVANMVKLEESNDTTNFHHFLVDKSDLILHGEFTRHLFTTNEYRKKNSGTLTLNDIEKEITIQGKCS